MKKNLLSVLILVLMIVNIAMSAVMMISVTSTNQKTAALMDSIGAAMNLEFFNSGTDVPLSDSEPYSLGSMTIHLDYSRITNPDGTFTTSDKQVYIVFDISLLQNTKHEDYLTYGGENIATYEAQIKDAVEKVVSAYTEEECRAYFNEDIRNEILKAIQDLFQSKFIYQITLSNVKYG